MEKVKTTLSMCAKALQKSTVVFNEMKDKGLYFDIAVYSMYFCCDTIFFLLNDIPT